MKPHVLIVEDDFLQSANLAEVVQQDLDAEPLAVSSVSEALKIIPDNLELAILDIEVVDGKSYPAARKLMHNDIPVIFISANARASLPDDLKTIPFLSKPFVPGNLVRLSKTLTHAFA
jgi:two-component SAPR family response regulator